MHSHLLWSRSLRTLSRSVQYSGVYRLFVDLMALVHANNMLGEPCSFEKAYVEHVWRDSMEIG